MVGGFFGSSSGRGIVIARRRLAQAAAAAKLGVSQPKVSALANSKLGGFSVVRARSIRVSHSQGT